MADPAIAPVTAGPAPVRNASTVWLARIRSKRGPPSSEREGWGEGDERGEEPAADAGRGDRLHHGAGGDLTEGDSVEELGAGHPVVGGHGVVLHERDDHEPAAIR